MLVWVDVGEVWNEFGAEVGSVSAGLAEFEGCLGRFGSKVG